MPPIPPGHKDPGPVPQLPGWHHDGGDFFWVHDLALLLVVLALVVGAILIARMFVRRPPGAPRPLASGPALLELDLRYARGELGRDDFLQRRGDLLQPFFPSAPAPAPISPSRAPTTTAE